MHPIQVRVAAEQYKIDIILYAIIRMCVYNASCYSLLQVKSFVNISVRLHANIFMRTYMRDNESTTFFQSRRLIPPL